MRRESSQIRLRRLTTRSASPPTRAPASERITNNPSGIPSDESPISSVRRTSASSPAPIMRNGATTGSVASAERNTMSASVAGSNHPRAAKRAASGVLRASGSRELQSARARLARGVRAKGARAGCRARVQCRARGGPRPMQYLDCMVPGRSAARQDRVVERQRPVALARHYREAEGLSIRQIADRLGRSPATVKAYFYRPTGEKARAVKRRYQGCAEDAARLPLRGAARAARTSTASTAIRGRSRHGERAPGCEMRCEHGESSTDVRHHQLTGRERTHEGVAAKVRRLQERDWPAPSTVIDLYGTWSGARADAFAEN